MPNKKDLRYRNKPPKNRKPRTPSGLTPQRIKFITEYLKTRSAGDAALSAGYKNPNQGARLLKDPEIAGKINEWQFNLIKETDVTVTKIIEELATIGFMPLAQLDRRVRCKDKIEALKLLGMYHKMFVQRHEIEEPQKKAVFFKVPETMSVEDWSKAIEGGSEIIDAEISEVSENGSD